jgi:hypothetical protein
MAVQRLGRSPKRLSTSDGGGDNGDFRGGGGLGFDTVPIGTRLMQVLSGIGATFILADFLLGFLGGFWTGERAPFGRAIVIMIRTVHVTLLKSQ